MNFNIEIEEVRSFFPVTKNLIYFDHAAVSPIHKGTEKVIAEYTSHFLNYGIKDYTKWVERIEGVREGFAKFIGADASEIAFTKGTAAGISIFANGLEFKSGENVIVPDFEFPSNIYPWMNLKDRGVSVKFLKSPNNFINPDDIAELIDKNTRVVAISHVEFLNGYKNDLKRISEICKQKSVEFGRKIYLCVDAIQSLGALKLDVSGFDVSDVEIDFLAMDGHKWFLAMEGAGVIYCNKNILNDIKPVSVGWKSIKDKLNFTNINFDLDTTAAKFEEGSMNLAGILSLEASLELFNRYGIDNIEKRILSLTDLAISQLEEREIKISSCKNPENRSGIVTFLHPDADKLFLKLLANNVQLSKRGEGLRISPHFYNTEDEIFRFLEILDKNK